MKLSELISSLDLEHTTKLVDATFLETIEKTLGVTFGPELKDYVLSCGYLAKGPIELFGIVAGTQKRQGLESDMVTETLYLHETYSETKGLVALESWAEGDYVLVDAKDQMFGFVNGTLKPLNQNLSTYLQQRFATN